MAANVTGKRKKKGEGGRGGKGKPRAYLLSKEREKFGKGKMEPPKEKLTY